MYSTGRYIYAVFMSHLSIEKAFKGLWAKKFQEDAPRTHNLEYLREKLSINFPTQNLYDTILRLNKVCIPIRYPDDLQKISKEFPENITQSIINNTKDVLEWLKSQL
jgi:HEPN domain-containing protein